MATAMDLTSVPKLNTGYEFKKTAATATVANTSETFEFAIPDNYRVIERVVVVVEETGNQGDMTAQVLKGDSWAARDQEVVTCLQNKATIFSFEPGPAINLATGKIQITLTPASTKSLKTNHAATIAAALIKGNKR